MSLKMSNVSHNQDNEDFDRMVIADIPVHAKAQLLARLLQHDPTYNARPGRELPTFRSATWTWSEGGQITTLQAQFQVVTSQQQQAWQNSMGGATTAAAILYDQLGDIYRDENEKISSENQERRMKMVGQYLKSARDHCLKQQPTGNPWHLLEIGNNLVQQMRHAAEDEANRVNGQADEEKVESIALKTAVDQIHHQQQSRNTHIIFKTEEQQPIVTTQKFVQHTNPKEQKQIDKTVRSFAYSRAKAEAKLVNEGKTMVVTNFEKLATIEYKTSITILSQNDKIKKQKQKNDEWYKKADQRNAEGRNEQRKEVEAVGAEQARADKKTRETLDRLPTTLNRIQTENVYASLTNGRDRPRQLAPIKKQLELHKAKLAKNTEKIQQLKTEAKTNKWWVTPTGFTLFMELYQLIDDVAETEEMYEYVMKCLNAMVKKETIKSKDGQVVLGYKMVISPIQDYAYKGQLELMAKSRSQFWQKTATTLIGKINSLPQGF